MKFSISRKINLAHIDKDIFPFETEDIIVTDADSPEEAATKVDKVVAERIAYHQGVALEIRKIRGSEPTLIPDEQTTEKRRVVRPPAEGQNVKPAETPKSGEVSYGPPEEFND